MPARLVFLRCKMNQNGDQNCNTNWHPLLYTFLAQFNIFMFLLLFFHFRISIVSSRKWQLFLKQFEHHLDNCLEPNDPSLLLMKWNVLVEQRNASLLPAQFSTANSFVNMPNGSWRLLNIKKKIFPLLTEIKHMQRRRWSLTAEKVNRAPIIQRQAERKYCPREINGEVYCNISILMLSVKMEAPSIQMEPMQLPVQNAYESMIGMLLNMQMACHIYFW